MPSTIQVGVVVKMFDRNDKQGIVSQDNIDDDPYRGGRGGSKLLEILMT